MGGRRGPISLKEEERRQPELSAGLSRGPPGNSTHKLNRKRGPRSDRSESGPSSFLGRSLGSQDPSEKRLNAAGRSNGNNQASAGFACRSNAFFKANGENLNAAAFAQRDQKGPPIAFNVRSNQWDCDPRFTRGPASGSLFPPSKGAERGLIRVSLSERRAVPIFSSA